MAAAHGAYQRSVGTPGQSFGLMVNYLYEPEAIEENVEAFVGQGRIAAAASIRRLGSSRAK